MAAAGCRSLLDMAKHLHYNEDLTEEIASPSCQDEFDRGDYVCPGSISIAKEVSAFSEMDALKKGDTLSSLVPSLG